jgi:hypothetical protein
MKREELVQIVVNVLVRCGRREDSARAVAIDNLSGIAQVAAALAFTRNLTEDDDTRQLRWQYGDLMDKGTFTLEE